MNSLDAKRWIRTYIHGRLVVVLQLMHVFIVMVLFYLADLCIPQKGIQIFDYITLHCFFPGCLSTYSISGIAFYLLLLYLFHLHYSLLLFTLQIYYLYHIYIYIYKRDKERIKKLKLIWNIGPFLPPFFQEISWMITSTKSNIGNRKLCSQYTELLL